MTPRDSQRSRVYRAETPMGGRRLPMLPDCAAFVDEVVGSLWWIARFPERDLDRVPKLRPGNGARQAFYREDPGRPTITLPRRYRTTAVVLHELVHWALSDAVDLPNHGRTFTRIFLDATGEFLGPAKREKLARSYTEHKVRLGGPARVAPDGSYDYTVDERLRLGRGRHLAVRWGRGSEGDGVLRSRAHRKVTLQLGDETTVIPEREIWWVRPYAPAQLSRSTIIAMP